MEIKTLSVLFNTCLHGFISDPTFRPAAIAVHGELDASIFTCTARNVFEYSVFKSGVRDEESKTGCWMHSGSQG